MSGWRLTVRGRYGDHGGLLIVAKHETEGPADSLLFSIDQGTCWHEIGLEEAIDVGNIRRAPAALQLLKPRSLHLSLLRA